jgi:hypothetical protein
VCKGYDWWSGEQADVRANNTNSAAAIRIAALAFLDSQCALNGRRHADRRHAGSMDGGSMDGGSMDGGSMDGGSTDGPSPFFLYVAFQNVHGPYTCDQQYYDLYTNRSLSMEEQTLFG